MHTAFTERFGLDHPVIQGSFGGGLSTALLTATVSNLGGPGSFGVEPYAPAEIIAHTAEIRARTSRPFNVNLWVSVADPSGESLTDAPGRALSGPIQVRGPIGSRRAQTDRTDLVSVWSGQIAPNLRHRSARALMAELTTV